MAQPRPSHSPPLHPESQIPWPIRVLVSALGGATLGAAYTSPGWPLLAWVSLALLIAMAIGARPRTAFWCGFIHAIVFVLTCLFWIATVLKVHGGMSYAGGVGVLLLIATAWGSVNGFFAWFLSRLSRAGVTRACLAAPFLWVSIEFLRDHLPEIAFPWNLLGYPAAASLALVQAASVTGIFGLSFLAAAYNSLLTWAAFASGEFSLRIRFAVLGGVSILLAAVVIAGPQFVPASPPASHYARAVQPNLPELLDYPREWFQRNAENLDEFERLSLAPSNHTPDLLIWPEAPAPFSFQDAQFARRASSLAIRFGHPFLAGAVEWRSAANPAGSAAPASYSAFNSAIMLDAQGQRIFVYDKIHLVPFGEYEPFPLIHRVVRSLSEDVGGFRSGSNYAVGGLPGGQRFGVFICYESIFPGEVRRFVAGGANLLINISNDGWFGRSAAPEQHLRMARVRAVENRRWLVRVTNNGYTVSIDPYGRIVSRVPADARQAADLPYDFRADSTLYTRFGDWIAWLCVLVSLAFLASSFLKPILLPN
jgi:apolipoprotein N-acyltransferase